MKDWYDISSSAVMTLHDFYGERRNIVDTCLIILSTVLHDCLLSHYECSEIGRFHACNGDIVLYQIMYKDKKIAFYLSAIGSALASQACYEASWLSGATKFVMCGSCGALDSEKVQGRYIIPTEAYRGEGASYYYAPESDYIEIKGHDLVCGVFERLHIPYVEGRVWTTDVMMRETRNLVNRRKQEGCIAVEMELAGVQAACNFYGLQLYDFLEPGDVLDRDDYDCSLLASANHDERKLIIALEIAYEI